MTINIPSVSPTLVTLAEAANLCCISFRELLTYALKGAIDLCIKVPERHTPYVVLKNYVNLNGMGGFTAVPFPDLVAPRRHEAAFAVLLTREHCNALLEFGEASLEYFPGAIEYAEEGGTTVVRPWDLNFLPGLEERWSPLSPKAISELSSWITTGGMVPFAATTFGLSELSYWADTRGVLFRLEDLPHQKPEPWCPLDARARQVRHFLEYWFCLYPDSPNPSVSPDKGIVRPSCCTVTMEEIRVSTHEIEDFLAGKAADIRYQRDYGKESAADELPNGASQLLITLNEAAIEIWGGVRLTDETFLTRAEVASLLVDKYKFSESVATSAASIIHPDFAEESFSPIKRAMLGRSFRSFQWLALIDAFERFWEGKDVTKPENSTANVEVAAWLSEVHRFPEDVARHAATIVRPDNAARALSKSTAKKSKKR